MRETIEHSIMTFYDDELWNILLMDQWSKETGDIQCSNEPQITTRISFCLNMRNEAFCSIKFTQVKGKENDNMKSKS